MAPKDHPDAVIGVDIGTTGTGVACSLRGKPPQVIRTWPGAQGNHDKVPTVVSYYNDSGERHGWGFNADDVSLVDDRNITVHRHLKTRFANRGQRTDEDEQDWTEEEAVKHLKFFLQELCQHVEEALEDMARRNQLNIDWMKASICYAFSHPTTWDEDTVVRFEKVVREAGFVASKAFELHYPNINTSLDEAQSAMSEFFSRNDKPSSGQNVMVADMGGGTSDVATFAIEAYQDATPKINPLGADQGTDAGSVKIDKGIARTLKSRLRGRLAEQSLPSSTDSRDRVQRENDRVRRETDRMIMSEPYKDAKRLYRSSSGPRDAVVRLMHHLYDERDNPEHGSNTLVERLERRKFEPLFKEQCDTTWGQIVSQLRPEQEDGQLSSIELHHFVLTGGLGSSPYVYQYMKEKLQKHFSDLGHLIAPEIHPTKEDYKTTVCKGLVEYVIGQINGTVAWGYTSIANYGIVDGVADGKTSWFLRQGRCVALPRPGEKKRKLWSKSFKIEAGTSPTAGFNTGLRIVKLTTDGNQQQRELVGSPFIDKIDAEKWAQLEKKEKFYRRKPTATIMIEIYAHRGEFVMVVLQKKTEIAEVRIHEQWHGDPLTGKRPFGAGSSAVRRLEKVLPFIPIVGSAVGLTVMLTTGIPMPTGPFP